LDKLSERVDQDSSSRERPAIRDSVALTQLTVRLDQIEHWQPSMTGIMRPLSGFCGEEESRRRGCAGLRNCCSHDKAQQVGEESRHRGRKLGQSPPTCRAETIVAYGKGGTFRPE
jgi:hypothetical protein